MDHQGETSYKNTKIGILPRSKIIQLEAIATKKGLKKLAQLAKQRDELSIPLILDLYKDCYAQLVEKGDEEFRKIQVTYSGKEAPHFAKVRELVTILIGDTEFALSKLPSVESDNFLPRVIEVIAHFQHRFVLIHPFVDYNGRMSRMLSNFLLMRLELPIMEIDINQPKMRERYIKSLQAADEGDYTKISKILTQSLHESLEKIV